MAGCVALTLGGIVLSGCATTQEITYSYPTPSDIASLMEDWDRLERETNIRNNKI